MPLEADGPVDLARDRRYAGVAIPNTESLKDTIARVLPYWESRIAPELRAGKRVLISAHGNSLRALVKHLSGISDAEITGLEIPTGQPLFYELNDDLREIERSYLSERLCLGVDVRLIAEGRNPSLPSQTSRPRPYR